ncbi:hypothetical protein Taro_020243 [Colocasia esculenta]|uniref:Uncharacterized protein n=1 Tax=Colocasia esculenta TaxID=4460 RepID=A0A843V1T8_COLES|nr:hypothetical protein [Colocasia esculenta]
MPPQVPPPTESSPRTHHLPPCPSSTKDPAFALLPPAAAVMETLATDRHQEHLPLQLLLAFLFAVAVGLCASAVLKRKCVDREGRAAEGRPPAGCASLKQALLGTVRWSSSRKLGEWDSGRWEGLDLPARAEGGWDSLVETAAAAAGPLSPLWQRRILMGERCELPRFSGLILYDERGFPLHANTARAGQPSDQQDKSAMVVTTLRDLL